MACHFGHFCPTQACFRNKPLPPSPRRMKTVLLIDDDHAFRNTLTELLKTQGWEVFEAPDGEIGLNIAMKKRPDVVVCDLLMPRCNGFQFCRAIKQQRAFLPNVRIVEIGRASCRERV